MISDSVEKKELLWVFTFFK